MDIFSGARAADLPSCTRNSARSPCSSRCSRSPRLEVRRAFRSYCRKNTAGYLGGRSTGSPHRPLCIRHSSSLHPSFAVGRDLRHPDNNRRTRRRHLRGERWHARHAREKAPGAAMDKKYDAATTPTPQASTLKWSAPTRSRHPRIGNIFFRRIRFR